MRRLMLLLLGAAVFLAVHVIEVAGWAWFGPEHQPWFLNSGRAAGFAAVCLAAASAVAAGVLGSSPRDAALRGSYIAAGAFVAIACMLSAVGPGTIFPIVLAFSALFAAATGIVGALFGWYVARAITRSP